MNDFETKHKLEVRYDLIKLERENISRTETCNIQNTTYSADSTSSAILDKRMVRNSG